MYYKLWHDAERGTNEYIPTEVHWSEVPGRDAEWKAQTIRNTSEQQFRVEFECEFLGSVDTLISPSKLRVMAYEDPIESKNGLDVFKEPEKDHNYTMTVDVARGIDGDYSAFCLFDTTTVPYQLVAKYRNNTVKPMLFPDIICQVAKAYNHAYILVEVNDVGAQVADIIQYDLEYDNLLMAAMRGRAGQVVGQGFSGGKVQLGVKMSSAVKKLGCSNLKQLLEDDKMLLSDYDIIAELTTFIQKGQSWQAEEGCNDDLAMCLVMFARSLYKIISKNCTTMMYVLVCTRNNVKQSNRIWHLLGLWMTVSMILLLSIPKDKCGTRMNMVTGFYMWEYR